MTQKKQETSGRWRARLRRVFCVTTGTHCRMEVQGDRVLWLQGCREIEEYSPTYIVLRVRDATLTRVCVWGERLLCCSYHEDGMEITGEIRQVQLCGEGE